MNETQSKNKINFYKMEILKSKTLNFWGDEFFIYLLKIFGFFCPMPNLDWFYPQR